jgi:hypothetical protein
LRPAAPGSRRLRRGPATHSRVDQYLYYPEFRPTVVTISTPFRPSAFGNWGPRSTWRTVGQGPRPLHLPTSGMVSQGRQAPVWRDWQNAGLPPHAARCRNVGRADSPAWRESNRRGACCGQQSLASDVLFRGLLSAGRVGQAPAAGRPTTRRRVP